MTRPGLTLALWFAIAVLVIANNAIGDTWIASTLSARAVEWFKVLVPLPYVVLLAAIVFLSLAVALNDASPSAPSFADSEGGRPLQNSL